MQTVKTEIGCHRTLFATSLAVLDNQEIAKLEEGKVW